MFRVKVKLDCFAASTVVLYLTYVTVWTFHPVIAILGPQVLICIWLFSCSYRMSRPRSYTYARHTSMPAYFYDDLEGYVGDYSESEGLSDAAPHLITGFSPDVTELYRRKTVAAMTSTQDHYANTYMQASPPPPADYYYEALSQPPAMVSRPAAYRKRIPVISERHRYYSPERPELYDQMAYRSTHQLVTSLPRTAVPASIPSATAVRQPPVRRHPITVRTPRYYRRPSGPAVIKRPSALCLPVSCQPDPAVFKRAKRMAPVQPLYPQEYIYQQPVSQPKNQFNAEKLRSPNQKFPSDYDLNITKSKLDAALERYEQIFEKNVVEFTGAPPDVKLVRMLKPKVPATIIEKEQSSRLKKRKNIDWTNAGGLDVEGITSDALEEMLLADLQANGFANDEAGDFKLPTKDSMASSTSERKDHEKTPRSADVTITNEKMVKDLPKSFNYEEIQNNVAKAQKSASQHTQQSHNSSPRSVSPPEEDHFEMPEQDIIPSKDLKASETPPTKDQSPHTNFSPGDPNLETHSRPISHTSSQRKVLTETFVDKSSDSLKSMRTAIVPRVLVDDALELHRTKSYVVSLIDHALSNHFGTNLCEKYSTKENPIDHRVAVEILKKHSAGKMDKELCVEIAQALADTFNSSTSCASAAPSRDSEPKHESSSCSCNKISEEPLYVKQLKQLRWGHLKHIQREVRRLEDLERFLDSCSSNSFV